MPVIIHVGAIVGDASIAREPMLFRNQDGKAVGKLKNNGKKITLTLACSALGADQEKTLHAFVNRLVSSKSNAEPE